MAYYFMYNMRDVHSAYIFIRGDVYEEPSEGFVAENLLLLCVLKNCFV